MRSLYSVWEGQISLPPRNQTLDAVHSFSSLVREFLLLWLTIILLVVLYGCETWSLTLRGERRLRVFENRVLRKVFGPKRDEVTG